MRVIVRLMFEQVAPLRFGIGRFLFGRRPATCQFRPLRDLLTGIFLAAGLVLPVNGQQNPSFSPADLAPLAWYKVDSSVKSGASAAAPGNLVTAWFDSSGNANHLLNNQGASMRPTLNGAGYIEGDGGDFLACATFKGVNAQPVRIVALAQFTSVTSNALIWSGANQTSPNLSARGLTGNRLTASAGGPLGDIEGPVADTTQRLFEVLYQGNNSTFRINGLGVDSTGNIGSDPVASLGLFGRFNAGTVVSGAQIRIWEVVVLQGTSASEQNATKVRNYFASKFGIEVVGTQATLLATQTFGSGLTFNNPSQHAALSISEPVPGLKFLTVGDQDMAQKFTSGRKGCVHVFKDVSGSWVYHQRLISPLTRVGQWMGHAVRSGGPWIMCGNTHSLVASGRPEGEIEAWKYNPATGYFAFHSVLQPDDCINGDEFGMLLDCDFETGWMIAGSPQLHDYNPATGGKIYFYKLIDDNWTQMQMFREPGAPHGFDNGFGMEVCIRGNDAFASSKTRPAALGGGYFRGCLYHYKFNGTQWVYHAHIPSPSSREGQRFGATVHFDGTRLVSFDWGLKWFQGGFTVLRKNGDAWIHETTYIQPWGEGVNNGENHRFGHKGLFVNGDTIIASERFAYGNWADVHDMNGPTDAKGIVWVYKRIGTQWYRSHVIAPGTRQPGDWFGDLMCVESPNKLLVVSTGAYRNGSKTMILQRFGIGSDPLPEETVTPPPPPLSDLVADPSRPNAPDFPSVNLGPRQPDGKVRLMIGVDSDHDTVLERSSNLRDWTPAESNIPAGNYFLDVTPNEREFFRLRLSPR